MGNFFEKNWQRSSSDSTRNIRNLLHKEAPLKPRIIEAIKQLNIPLTKLDAMYQKICQQNQSIFEQVINAQKNNEMQKASILASELAVMRKQKKMIENARLALEKIKIRLTTIEDFGEAMIAMKPATSIISSIKPSLDRMMPESDYEINEMNEMLRGIMNDTLDESNAGQFDVNALSGVEMNSILQEANSILEKDIEERLPDIPSTMHTESNTQTTAVYD